MTRSEFSGFVAEQFKELYVLMQHKNTEYADDCDAFSNFKTAGEILDILPEQALYSFMTKHTVSIRDIILSGEFDHNVLKEKVGDVIIYHLLLLAMVTPHESTDDAGETPAVSSSDEG